MFVKISPSLTGSLITLDGALLAALSTRTSVFLVWQMRPIVGFLFSYVSPEFGTTLLALRMIGREKKKREQ